MKRRIYCAVNKYFIWMVLFVSVASCTHKEKSLSDMYGNTVEKQKIYLNQHGKTDSSLNYSFYLPNKYNGKDLLPILFFFDPHGDGSLPLKNYQSLADKFGYILVGSYNIKNGLPGSVTFPNFQQLLKETESRFLVDTKREFIAGFSGGAKLAIIFAQQLPQITGVIACGASIPLNGDELPNYYYVGVVGTADFNYLETQQTFSTFDRNGINYTAITFEGKHQWPPKPEFDLAISGLELHCMKTNRMPKNGKWLNSIWNQMQDSVNYFEKKQDYIAEMLTLRQIDLWFDGIRDVKEIKKQQEALINNPQFVAQANKRQGLLQKEIVLRSEYIKAIGNRDLGWWKTEIVRFRETTSNPDKELALIGQRLINYLSMVSFMLTKSDLDEKKLDEAYKKNQIYEMADPTNPDVHLMYARYYLLKDNKELMVQHFEQAIDLGFKSWETYSNDASWKALFEKNEILALKK